MIKQLLNSVIPKYLVIIDFPADTTEEFVQVFQDDPRIARLVIMQGQFADTIWV